MPPFDARLLFLVKMLIIIQFCLIMGLILATAICKYYFSRREKRRLENQKNLKKMLLDKINQKQELDGKSLKQCEKLLDSLLIVIKELDNEVTDPHWHLIRKTLITKIILPKAREYTKAKNWFKRYMATQCFNLDYEKEDSKYLEKLLKDSILLVSLNAAAIAINNPTQNLIDTIINTYSKDRRIHQTTIAKVITNSDSNIAAFVLKHLSEETDPYARAFCYRLLTDLPPQDEVAPIAFSDTEKDIVDLRVTAMSYLAHNNAKDLEEILRQQLDNPDWQTRAIAVKLLGQLKFENAAALIAKKLNDSQWWVRINAAQALAQLGTNGLGILRSQKSTEDHFAYQAAMHVLETLPSDDEQKE